MTDIKALSIVIKHWITDENKIRRENRDRILSSHLEDRQLISLFWAMLDLKYAIDIIGGDSTMIETAIIVLAHRLNHNIVGIDDDYCLIIMRIHENKIILHYCDYDLNIIVATKN